MKNTTMISAALAALALTACGDSAPGDADVRAALETIAKAAGGKDALAGQEDAFAKIKVNKCVKDELGGFKCEFTSPMGGTQVARFKKGPGGWTMVGVGG